MNKKLIKRFVSTFMSIIFTLMILPTFPVNRAEASLLEDNPEDISVNCTPYMKKAVQCSITKTKLMLDHNENLYVAGYYPTEKGEYTSPIFLTTNVLDVIALQDSFIVSKSSGAYELVEYKIKDGKVETHNIDGSTTFMDAPDQYAMHTLGGDGHLRYMIYRDRDGKLHAYGGTKDSKTNTVIDTTHYSTYATDYNETRNKSTKYYIYGNHETQRLIYFSETDKPAFTNSTFKGEILYVDNGIVRFKDKATGKEGVKVLHGMFEEDYGNDVVGAINIDKYDVTLVAKGNRLTVELDNEIDVLLKNSKSDSNLKAVYPRDGKKSYMEFPSKITKVVNNTIYTEDKAYCAFYKSIVDNEALYIEFLELPSKDIQATPSYDENSCQMYYEPSTRNLYRATIYNNTKVDKLFTLPGGSSLVSCSGSWQNVILTDDGKVYVSGTQTNSDGHSILNYTSGEVRGLGIATISGYQQIPLDIFSKWVEPTIIDKAGVTEWVAPKKGEITITCIGGSGSVRDNGGFATGDLQVEAGQKLYCVVGSDSIADKGGFNGGGQGYIFNMDGKQIIARGGGGATDVRTAPTSPTALNNTLMNRIIVAGGGGGDFQTSSGNYSFNELLEWGWGGYGNSIDSYARGGYDYRVKKEGRYVRSHELCLKYDTVFTNEALLGKGESSINCPYPHGGAGGGGYIGGGVHAECGGQGGANFTGGVSNPYDYKASLSMNNVKPKVIIQYKDNPLSNIIITATPSRATTVYNKINVELNFSHITSDGHSPAFVERKYNINTSPTPPKDMSVYKDYNYDTITIKDRGTGSYFIHAYAKDVEGNETIQTFGAYTLGAKDASQDGSIVPVITASTTEWTNKDVMITIKPSSREFRYLEYKIGNGKWQEYYKPFAVTEEGIYKVYARAKNKMGDTTSSSNVEVKIDKTPPVISMSGLREEIIANSPTEKSHYWYYWYTYSKKGHRRIHWKTIPYDIDHFYSLASFTVEDKKKGNVPCSGCIPDTIRVNDKVVQSGRIDDYTTPTGAYLVSKSGESLTCAYKINLKVHDRHYGNTQTTSNCDGRDRQFDYTNYPSSPKLATPHDYRVVVIAKDRAGNVAMLMPSLLSKFDPDVFIAGNKMDVFKEDKKDGHTFRKETLIFNDKEQLNLTVVGQIYTNKEPLRLDIDEVTEDGVPVHVYDGKVFNSVADDFTWHKSDNNDDHSLNEIDDLVRFTYDLPIRMNLAQPLATKYFKMKVVGFNSGNTYYNKVYKVHFANKFADNYLDFKSNGNSVSASFKSCMSQLEALKDFNINRNQIRWKICTANELGQQTSDILKSKTSGGSSINSSLSLGSKYTTLNNRRLLIGQPNVFGVVKDIGNPVEIQFLNVTKDPIITDSQFTVQVHVRANEHDYYLPTDLQKLKNDGIHIEMIRNGRKINENTINENDFVFDKNYSENLTLTITDQFNNTKTSSTKLLFLNKNGISSGIRVKNDNSYVLTTKGIFDITSKFFTEIKIPTSMPDLPFDAKVPYRGYKLSNGNILVFSNTNTVNPLINIYNSSLKLIGHITLPVSTPVLDIIEYQGNVYIATGFNGLYKVPITSFSNPNNLMATKEVSTTAYYMETFSNLLLLGSEGSQALQTYRISENNLVQENCIPATKIYEDSKYTSVKEIHVNGSTISVYPNMSNGDNTAFHVVISFLK